MSLSLSSPVRRSGPHSTIVRNVSQVNLRLERGQGDTFAAIQREVLDWIGRKAGKALPPDAWDGGSFELDEVGAQHVAAAHLDDPRYWSARIDDADREVAQRTWTTEIGLGQGLESEVLFGCRLIVSSRGENPPFQPSIPAFVRDIIRGGSAYLDGRLVTLEPWIVATIEDVQQLYGLIVSRIRRSDVCVFSLAEDAEDPTEAGASPRAVLRRTAGAAHVAIMTGSAAYALTDLVGKEFSVFNRAVRTYRPRFDTDIDDPLRHPIAFAHKISDWQDIGLQGLEAFENFLSRRLIAQTVAASDLERVLPPFSEVRRAASDIHLSSAQAAGTSQGELLRLYEEDNSKLRASADEGRAVYDGLLAAADIERDEAQRRAEEARGEAFRLSQRVLTLERLLKARGVLDAPPTLPADLSNLKAWGDAHLSGSVFLTNRALRGAKESDYEHPSLVYKALLLLRDQYVPMRREGGEELTQGYHDGLQNSWFRRKQEYYTDSVGRAG